MRAVALLAEAANLMALALIPIGCCLLVRWFGVSVPNQARSVGSDVLGYRDPT